MNNDLYIDLETCPDVSPGAVDRYIATVEPPGQYKKPESIAEWKAANGEAIGRVNWLRTALDPMVGGIYVVGWRTPGMEFAMTMCRTPEMDEAQFIREALGTIFAPFMEAGQPKIPRLIGWNHLNFDIPFLAKRCAILGVAPPIKLPTNSRYNSDRVLDLMQSWAGTRDYAKQSAVAAAMGLKDGPEIDGSQLWDAVCKDGVGVAANKCAADVDQLAAIHARMAMAFQL